MTEAELQAKREEFRDTEVQNRIAHLSTASEFRQQTLKTNYTRKKVKGGCGKIGWTIIIGQATFLIFFSTLFIIIYIPKTKFIVTKILP